MTLDDDRDSKSMAPRNTGDREGFEDEHGEGRSGEGEVGTVAGANRHGFVKLSRLHEEALDLGYEGFVANYPVPALIPIPRGMMPEDLEADDANDNSGHVQLLTMAVRSPGFLLYLGKVAFLAKRPGNPFPHLISIGRSPKNDITVAVDSVSKVHGYFVPHEGGWAFTDRGSTNGSKVDDRPVVEGERYPLDEGTTIRLGLEVMFEVHSPDSLYRRAQKGY